MTAFALLPAFGQNRLGRFRFRRAGEGEQLAGIDLEHVRDPRDRFPRRVAAFAAFEIRDGGLLDPNHIGELFLGDVFGAAQGAKFHKLQRTIIGFILHVNTCFHISTSLFQRNDVNYGVSLISQRFRLESDISDVG